MGMGGDGERAGSILVMQRREWGLADMGHRWVELEWVVLGKGGRAVWM